MGDETGDARDWAFWRADSAFRSAGGIVGPRGKLAGDPYLYEVIRAAFGRATHFLATTSYAERFTQTSFFFVDSQSVNAVAAQRGRRRVVGVHVGAPRWIWSAFRCGLTDERFAECFLEGAPVVPRQAIDISNLLSPDLCDLPEDWPAARLNFLRELYTRAADFLIFHELAHHARGHVELVQRKLGQDVVEEGLNAAAIEHDGDRLLRFIEFDADLHALDMQWLARDARRPSEGREEEGIASDLTIDVIAITTLFILLDAAHSSIDLHYTTSHPPPVHRAMRATYALADTYAREFGWDWNRIVELHDEGWTEASRIAVLLGMPEGRWQGDTTEEMHADRLEQEEQAFMEFSRALDDENEATG